MGHRNKVSNTNLDKIRDYGYDNFEQKLEHVFDDMKGRDNNRDRHAHKKIKDKDYRRKYGDDYED